MTNSLELTSAHIQTSRFEIRAFLWSRICACVCIVNTHTHYVKVAPHAWVFIISKQTRARERADTKLPDVRTHTHTQMYYVVFTSAMPEHRNGGPGAMRAVARTGVQINLEPCLRDPMPTQEAMRAVPNKTDHICADIYIKQV